ncbi:MAG: lipopolysaccharide biosynthesis protein [Acidobacteriota bacterium]|nr:lipopolysaccharide biosynthesis protein [Acidobacteriota bacterium]
MKRPRTGSVTAKAVADSGRYLRTDHLRTDLKGRSIRSSAVTLVSQGCKFFLQIGMTVVLARLLTPEDYGLFGVAFAVTTFFALFKDLGLSLSTVQSAEINHEQISTLFWINAALGCTLALLVALVTPLISWFYGEPRLASVMLAMAAGFVLIGVSGQHQALLRRQMRFTTLVIIETTAMFVGATVAVISAWHGARYWALVFMHLSMETVQACGVWITCGWRPGLPSRRAGVRSMLAFGGHLTAFDILSYFTHVFDNLLIGWYWGARQLGFYEKAYQLLMLPVTQFNAPISGVAHTTLSRLRNEPERYRIYLNKCILLTVGCGMPLVAFLFVAADEAVPLILGPQWVSVIPIFRALAPAAFLRTFTVCTGWIFVSLGRTGRQFRWALVTTTITVLIFLVAVRWGPVGVAVAYSCWRSVVALPTLIYCCKDSPLRWTKLVETAVRPALAAVGAAVGLVIIERWLPLIANPFVDLVCDGVLYGSLYLAIWLVLPDGRRILTDNLRLITILWQKPEAVYQD